MKKPNYWESNMRLLLFLLMPSLAFGAETLLEPTASAGTSASFCVSNNGKSTVIVHAASGLTAGEYTDIQISHDGGTTFQDLYDDGIQVRLSSTNNSVTVYGPGCFRADMEDPTNATGIYRSYEGSL